MGKSYGGTLFVTSWTFGFFDIHANFEPSQLLLRWKQTNKQKKTTSKYHCWTICFFRYSCQFWTKPIIAQMETNKQTKKRQLPNNTVERFVFFSFSSQFWHPKKSINVLFFFSIFVTKPFGERCCCCSLRHFIATNVFAFNVCFCSKAFLLLKKEKFTCADKTFFYLVLGTRGLDKQIKNIFFRWSKRYLESEKKRAKNTSSASHHVAQLCHITVI